MNIQLQAAADIAGDRRPETAAVLSLWSRAYTCLSDACLSLTRGSYVSCPPLLRTAADCIAAQRSLIDEGFDAYREWLSEAIAPDQEHAATSIAIGRYRGGSVLAADERLGRAYRLLTDLTMPHFGATLLQTGPDSTRQRLSLAFGDAAFHLGWAELVAGWLLLLADAQIETALGIDGPHAGKIGRDAEQVRLDVEEALGSPRRCRAEEPPDGRWLIHNFRRAVSGTPKRIIL